jgi:hypothetical protein
LSNTPNPPSFSITSPTGASSTDGGYQYWEFTADSTFTVNNSGDPGTFTVEYIIVAGGGGSGGVQTTATATAGAGSGGRSVEGSGGDANSGGGAGGSSVIGGRNVQNGAAGGTGYFVLRYLL